MRTLQLGGLGQGCRKLPHFARYHYFAVLYCSAIYFILLGNIFSQNLILWQLASQLYSQLQVFVSKSNLVIFWALGPNQAPKIEYRPPFWSVLLSPDYLHQFSKQLYRFGKTFLRTPLKCEIFMNALISPWIKAHLRIMIPQHMEKTGGGIYIQKLLTRMGKI